MRLTLPRVIEKMTRLPALTLMLGLLAAARIAGAQGCRGCVAEDTTPRTHLLPALGLHVGTPQKASLALGIVVGEDWRKNGRDHSRNIALFAEPGVSAGRASVAYVDQGFGSFGSGFGVAATALRTWRDPWMAKDNATYVGGDILVWPIVFVGPRVGIFRRITGTGTSGRWFVSVDLGIGL